MEFRKEAEAIVNDWPNVALVNKVMVDDVTKALWKAWQQGLDYNSKASLAVDMAELHMRMAADALQPYKKYKNLSLEDGE